MRASSSTKRTLRRDAAGSMGGQYTRAPGERPRRWLLPPAALQLEQVVQLGEHEEKAQLLVRPAEAHAEPPLRRFPLDQHQRSEPRAVHGPRRREVDHEP